MSDDKLETVTMNPPSREEREERRREENLELRVLVSTIQVELSEMSRMMNLMLTKFDSLPCKDHAVLWARLDERLTAVASRNGVRSDTTNGNVKQLQTELDLLGLLVAALKSRAGVATGVSAVVVALYEAIKMIITTRGTP